MDRAIIIERILAKTIPVTESGCLLFTGTVDRCGYGLIKIGPKRCGKAHRVLYELTVGAVPDGLQLDHLCRVRCCVNIRHLEPVTLQENLRRGLGNKAAVEALKKRATLITHCPQGHAYTPDNVRMHKNMRSCKACNRDRAREYQRAKKRQNAPPPVCLAI